MALDALRERIAAEDDTAPESGVLPENLSHVIFTSGSTGRPKGVMIRHSAVVLLLRWLRENVSDEERAGVLGSTSVSFDVSVAEIFGALCWGGRLVLVENALELPSVADQEIRLATMVPTAAAELLRAGGIPASVRGFNLAGEALPADLARGLYALSTVETVRNLFGPTEDTTYSTCSRVEPGAEQVLIGRALAGSRAYVLDAGLEPAPVGVPGELYLAGEGLARGYASRPELTAERFLPDPFGPAGSRLYRTGDRARWRARGELEYLGRADHQVKVRGFRIEPGEVEAALRAHPAVREAVVVAREDAPGGKRLVAYVVADGAEAPAAELRARLRSSLPDYMVPSAFVVLEALPLTPSGKLDRGALPAPEAEPGDAYVPPRTPTEEALAAVWAEVLGVERVGAADDFFALGGHSLLATRLVARVRDALGTEPAVRAVFEAPTVAELAARLDAARAGGEAADAPPIVPVPRDRPLPLSFAQQRLWLVDRMEPGSAAYVMSAALRLRGRLDPEALERAFGETVRRHEALRTVFAERGGEPVQVVRDPAPVALPVTDLRHLPAGERERAAADAAARGAQRPFDLAAGPLLRAELLRLDAEEWALRVDVHHAVADGWSVGVLVGELSEAYSAAVEGRATSLPDLPVQYADYAVWQRGWLRGGALERETAYWRERLAGAPPLLDLPTDRPRPPTQGTDGGSRAFAVPPAAADALRALARREGATPFMALAAAWQLLLSRWSGQEDVLVGTPVAGRRRRELEPLVGFFVNTLVLRTDLGGDPGFRALLGRVREATLGALAHQEVPFEKLVEELAPERSLSHTPFFQAVIALGEGGRALPRLAGLEAEPLDTGPGAAKFDLTLELADEGPGGFRGALTYRAELWDGPTVERMLGHLGALLAGAAADPERPVSALPVLDAAERARVLEEWNATERPYPAGLRVHDLFAAQAARTPAAVAVVHRGETVTYAELDRRSARLASALRRRGVGPETRVGVCMGRTSELLVALLAVLRAGGAYVPLDPAYPRERLGFMVEDARVGLVLTEPGLAGRLPEGGAVPVFADAASGEPDDALESGVLPENLSHVIFTSGSTGRPKGVMIRHSSTVVLLHWLRENVSDEERSSVLFSTSINFDVSVAEVFGTLCWGGRLVLVESALELASLVEPVVYASMVPSAAAELLRAGGIPASVRTLNLGGEALPGELAQALYALGTVDRVGNLYGPTEDTTYSTYSVVERGGGRVHVGRPVANTRAYVLDRHLHPVPVGVVGELYLAGDGLARGYASRPDLTAERFLPDPFGAPGARMYRVMDRVRRRPDGVLEYLGRTDHQVKVRGFRIELGEVEAVLGRHPSVRDVVAVVREDRPGDRRIVAYVTGAGAAAGELRAHAGAHLPEYMVPSAVVVLDAFPLTPNGKTDRGALPAPEAPSADAHVEPATPTEKALAGIWAEVLGVERVGARDDFFALGGHSLLAARVAGRVREELGADLPLRALFEAATVEALAARVEALSGTGAPPSPLVPVPRDRPLPVSSAQRRLWLEHHLSGAPASYNLAFALRLRGGLSADALRGALEAVVARHEALRTRIVEEDGEPVQVVEPPAPLDLPFHDLAPLGGAEREAAAARHAEDEAARPFDLERAPLLRAALLRLGAREHVLLVTAHHAAFDGWSQGVLTRELGALYAARLEGRDAALPALEVQYGDYAAWQRRRDDADETRSDAEFWRRELAGAPAALELHADRPRPAVRRFRGAAFPWRVPAAPADALRALARGEDATLFMALLAGFDAFLYRHTGQEDLVVGTPVAGRGHPALEPLVGCFVNVVPLRARVEGGEPFRTLLRRVRGAALDAFAHGGLSFEQVVDAAGVHREASRAPLVQVLLALQNTPPERLSLPGLEAEPLETEGRTSRYDLSVYLREEPDGSLAARVEYDTDLFDRVTVEGWMGSLGRLLEAAAADPDVPVGELPVLDAAERDRVLHEWNDTAAPLDPGATLPALFAAQLRRTPDAVALVHGAGTLTYAGLDRRAGELARELAARGVGPESRVGLLLERSAGMVAAMLAVHRAGGAYVPLDPAYPDGRLGYMLEDSGARVLVTQPGMEGRLAGFGGETVVLGAEEGVPAGAPEPAVSPSGAAYVIYTSGSTGRPKGVVVEHRNVAAFFAAMTARVGGAPGTWLATTSISFDISVLEILWTLSRGSTVVLHDARATHGVAERVRAHGVTHLQCTPSHASMLLSDPEMAVALRGVECVLLGGEALPAGLVRQLREATPARILNMYGPTETTVWSAAHEVDGAEGPIPIGRPVANTRAYVVDRRLGPSPSPVGVAGELWIGGAGVARGYLGRADATAERFVPDPFGAEPGARLYRTGDLARWRVDGTLEFLGRADQQVKVRGHRIEPAEVEAALDAHPAVGESAVVARSDGGEARLVAYWVPAAGGGDGPPSPGELRRWLAERLPDYMVPSLFVALERMPLTPNGKTDRRALPDPERSRPAPDEDYVPPRNELESVISGVWREVLGVERVGVRDNFFELGGTSVRLASVHRALAGRLERRVTLVDLFRYPTVGGLAEVLEQRDGGGTPPPRVQDRVQGRADRQLQAQAARQRPRR